MFDRLASEHLASTETDAVVELGAGLDTRFERLDDGSLHWFDLDLPAVTALREKYFRYGKRRQLLTGAIQEQEWVDELAKAGVQRPLLIIEGVLYFLVHGEVIQLLHRLAEAFPQGSVIFDAQSPFYLWYSNMLHPLRDSQLKWSLGDPRELEVDCPVATVSQVVRFGDEPYYEPQYLRRLPWTERLAARFVPGVKDFFKVCKLSFEHTLVAQ